MKTADLDTFTASGFLAAMRTPNLVAVGGIFSDLLVGLKALPETATEAQRVALLHGALERFEKLEMATSTEERAAFFTALTRLGSIVGLDALG